jgi:hypothetical protein
MKTTTKTLLRQFAAHFGFQIKYVDYFPAHKYGQLLVREKRILINSQQPRYEQIFTFLHEMAHIMMHVRKESRMEQHWFLHHHWNVGSIDRFVSKVRRYVRITFNKESGIEWEADLMAILAFHVISSYGIWEYDLRAFVYHHPEKWRLFLLAVAAIVVTTIKISMKRDFQSLRILFK